MSIERMLSRVFFAGALSLFVGAGAQQVFAAEAVADEELAPAECLDGDRKVCWTGPVGGGTGYKYWV